MRLNDHKLSERAAHRVGRGFTLVEIMVVVVIIGLLAGAVTVKVVGYVEKARKNRALADIATIMDAVETYHVENGHYPTNEEGLRVLPLRSMSDPWSRQYEYNSPGRDAKYEVFTLGADGVEGGEESDEDLGSWMLGSPS